MLRTIWNRLPEKGKKWVGKHFGKARYRVKANAFLKKYDMNEIHLPEAIEIETVNRCNGTCAFCPVNAKEKQRKYAKMTDELFHKIVDELQQLNYDGMISLYSNNEPFLDERIIEWNKIARESLPHAYIFLFTNGSLLTLEKVKDIMHYLDELVIDNYDERELNDNLMEIKKWADENSINNVRILPRIRDEVLTSRGGQAPNKKNITLRGGKRALPCLYPFRQMVIRPTGKVSLCCNDALGVYTMGDCSESKLIDIWNSVKFKKIRNELKTNGRKRLRLCKNCDTTTELKRRLGE